MFVNGVSKVTLVLFPVDCYATFPRQGASNRAVTSAASHLAPPTCSQPQHEIGETPFVILHLSTFNQNDRVFLVWSCLFLTYVLYRKFLIFVLVIDSNHSRFVHPAGDLVPSTPPPPRPERKTRGSAQFPPSPDEKQLRAEFAKKFLKLSAKDLNSSNNNNSCDTTTRTDDIMHHECSDVLTKDEVVNDSQHLDKS